MMMDIKKKKERQLWEILEKITSIIVQERPEKADEMDDVLRMSTIMLEYPISAIIGRLAYENSDAFTEHADVLAYALFVIGGMSNLVLERDD